MRKTILIFLSAWFLLSASPLAVAQPAPPPAGDSVRPVKITLVSIPGLSFMELKPSVLNKLPNLKRLTADGTVGALNVRTPSKGIDDSYLTLGAGAPAVGAADDRAWQRTERWNGWSVPQAYFHYTGGDSDSARIMVPEVEAIRRINEAEHYGARIGLLGESLAAHGVAVYAFGNADRGAAPGTSPAFRFSPLMVMDQEGKVYGGAIDGSTLQADTAHPFAVTTYYRYVLNQWKDIDGPALVLIELGDLDRLFAEKNRYAGPRLDQLKLQILQEMDRFLGQMLEAMPAESSLWLFSPMVHSDAMAAKWMMAPLVVYRPGESTGSRVFLSDTTRRPGIVTNLDLAPSLLRQFRIPVPAEMIGMPLGEAKRADALNGLIGQVERFARVYALRPKLLYSIVVFEMIVLLVSLWISIRKSKQGLRWMRIPLFAILLVPLVLLWVGSLAGTSTMAMMVFFFASLCVFTGLAAALPLLLGLGITGLMEALTIVADGLAGAPFMKQSVLGYDPMIGARYYGIGNEYMGVLIGAAALGCSMLLQLRSERRRRYVQSAASAAIAGRVRTWRESRFWPALPVGLFFMAITVYLASPGLGTNAGGAITAMAAFGIVWVRTFCGGLLKEIRWPRLMAVLGLLILASLAVLWLLNAWMPGHGQQSHIGRAMQALDEGRLDQIGRMIVRKLQMNLHLIGVSSWSKVLITSLLIIAVMVMKPWGLFRRWQDRYPLVMYGFSANSIGAIVTLLVNDSGIVAASTMIVYTAVPMLLLKLEE